MVTLKGDSIYLRALEQEDLKLLYLIENDPQVWEISGTIAPYSKKVLQLYLDNAHLDVFEVKQLRLVICNYMGDALGLIDLFDFDPIHKRAGLGIYIMDTENRNKGIGAEAIGLMTDYAFNILDLHQLFANILEENLPSIHLFKKLGFVAVGIKKDWIWSEGSFKNEILFQKIKS